MKINPRTPGNFTARSTPKPTPTEAPPLPPGDSSPPQSSNWWIPIGVVTAGQGMLELTRALQESEPMSHLDRWAPHLPWIGLGALGIAALAVAFATRNPQG